ncbi:MAG: hypothetical protein V3V61_03100 [Gammaproteobacteria bacterium]
MNEKLGNFFSFGEFKSDQDLSDHVVKLMGRPLWEKIKQLDVGIDIFARYNGFNSDYKDDDYFIENVYKEFIMGVFFKLMEDENVRVDLRLKQVSPELAGSENVEDLRILDNRRFITYKIEGKNYAVVMNSDNTVYLFPPLLGYGGIRPLFSLLCSVLKDDCTKRELILEGFIPLESLINSLGKDSTLRTLDISTCRLDYGRGYSDSSNRSDIIFCAIDRMLRKNFSLTSVKLPHPSAHPSKIETAAIQTIGISLKRNKVLQEIICAEQLSSIIEQDVESCIREELNDEYTSIGPDVINLIMAFTFDDTITIDSFIMSFCNHINTSMISYLQKELDDDSIVLERCRDHWHKNTVKGFFSYQYGQLSTWKERRINKETTSNTAILVPGKFFSHHFPSRRRHANKMAAHMSAVFRK